MSVCCHEQFCQLSTPILGPFGITIGCLGLLMCTCVYRSVCHCRQHHYVHVCNSHVSVLSEQTLIAVPELRTLSEKCQHVLHACLQIQHFYAHSPVFPSDLHHRKVLRYDMDYHHEVLISPRSTDISLQKEKVMVCPRLSTLCFACLVCPAVNVESYICGLANPECLPC